jgi:hypothetical protein
MAQQLLARPWLAFVDDVMRIRCMVPLLAAPVFAGSVTSAWKRLQPVAIVALALVAAFGCSHSMIAPWRRGPRDRPNIVLCDRVSAYWSNYRGKR